MSRTDLKNLAPPLTESRLARQYAAIAARAPAAPRYRRPWAAWALAGACAVALVVVVVRSHAPQAGPLVDGALIESGALASGASATSVTLADGSRVELGASTRARLTSAQSKAVRIDLERGSVEIEATHLDGRTFVVGAGAYDVHVVGTHFHVRRDPGAEVGVRVDRGVVEVTAAGEGSGAPRRLAAGEQWSAPDGTAAGKSAQASPTPTVDALAVPAPSASALNADPDSATASTPPAVAAGGGVGASSGHHDEGPKALFDDAQRARAEGRSFDAARAFDHLRHAYPHDPRAALAAFELGRLRLDGLGDPRGAEEALRDAMALGPSSPFREDAEARRVEALAKMGDGAGCAGARTAYLARWPHGTYRRAVEVSCGDR